MLLLEEQQMERDVKQYTLYDVRARTASFVEKGEWYIISDWPFPSLAKASMAVSLLLVACPASARLTERAVCVVVVPLSFQSTSWLATAAPLPVVL